MKLSSFSVILSFVVLMIIGAAMIPLVDVGDKPVTQIDKALMIRVGWPNIPANIVEQKVTSPLEGIISSVKGVKEVSSNSNFGESAIDVKLKDNANVTSVKFEIASLLRQTYDKLPKGVWYPWLGGGQDERKGSHNEPKLLVTYQINADMQPDLIKNFVEQNYCMPLKSIEGVSKVEVVGTLNHYIEINYDPDVLMTHGLSANDLANAVRSFIGRDDVVGDIVQNDPNGNKTVIALHLITDEFSQSLEHMPIKTAGNEIIYLNDLATFQYNDKEPESYFRVNGMNTIYLNVYVPADSKIIPLSNQVQQKMTEIKSRNSKNVCVSISNDAAKQQRDELYKLVTRTLLSIVILLVFVWITNRSWNNLFVVTVSLFANLLLSIIGYVLFEVQLNVYSLAGITVSLGLIIDSTIVIADHYSYYRNRKAFLSILAALLTTIGSLIIIFFLPKETRDLLKDFGWIIIINLTTSLLVALLFVPALIDQIHYVRKNKKIKYKKHVLLWNRFYYRYITFTNRHRWLCYTIIIVAFGLPIFALPDSLGESTNAYGIVNHGNQKWYDKFYNSTLGSDFFLEYCKEPLSKYLGGSMYLFYQSLSDNSSNNISKNDNILHINAKVPIEVTTGQLNQKVILLEKYLKSFKQIEQFVTQINKNEANIDICLKKQYKQEKYLLEFEEQVKEKAFSIGGVAWNLSGISPNGYSNDMELKTRDEHIDLSGYNFDQLNRYADNICNYLKKNNRVVNMIVEVPGYENQSDEYYASYIKPRLCLYNISSNRIYETLSGIFQNTFVGSYKEKIPIDIFLCPISNSNFDIWHLNNEQINSDGRNVCINDFMHIGKRKAKDVIPRMNQEYALRVSFNLLGPDDYINEYMDEVIKLFNKQLPVGYMCGKPELVNYQQEGTLYWLIVLIVVIIYFICAIQFESLKIPYIVISMIPVSLIGTFLTFYYTGIQFGDGGYASLVLLCGVTVNSALYLISQYLYLIRMPQNRLKSPVKLFICAYNHKIIPVMLTILSTILGLVPFFLDGTDEQFWFSFATGVSGGLFFSIFSFIFVIPIFLKPKMINSN